MPQPASTFRVYLESGSKRTFAGAIDWPGWCRGGRDEQAALQALVEYGVRYGRVAHAAHLSFRAPADSSALEVVERLDGGSGSDFGVPDAQPSSDAQVFGDDELHRSRALLRACWRTFDAAVEAARGKTLSTGPRGGGRDLHKLIEHVLGADAAYVRRLAWKYQINGDAPHEQQLASTREAIVDALAAAARGELPERGPRGGVLWPARYFVRRTAWHVLDHAWELEDRRREDE